MPHLFLTTVSAMALLGGIAFVLTSSLETDAYASTGITGSAMMESMTAPSLPDGETGEAATL
ncbi:MAG: hypothetical protein ACFB01_04995 [Cohaesibacteraceae bacterium]